MAILHHSGFSERVPPVLGVFQHRGSMRDPVRVGSGGAVAACAHGFARILAWHGMVRSGD